MIQKLNTPVFFTGAFKIRIVLYKALLEESHRDVLHNAPMHSNEVESYYSLLYTSHQKDVR
jgi:hypothetical protein